MLRILMIAGGFLTITAGLLYFQPRLGPATGDFTTAAAQTPNPRTSNAPVSQVQVSRAQSGVDLTGTGLTGTGLTGTGLTGTGAAAVNNDPLGSAVARAIAPTPTQTVVSASVSAPASDLQSMTASVLAELGAAPTASATRAASAPSDDPLRTMTSGVLASLTAATGGQADAPRPQKLENLIVQALQQGQSDSYIDALLNEAASAGQIQVPRALVTSDGRVDTVTLLASLVEKSSGHTGVDTAAISAAAGTRAPARPAKRLLQDEVYVVQPGDSLAAISHRFYGETVMYRQIFAANTDKLSSPDRIRVGQRLTIPAL